jgi:molybdate transport system substrate-binding protein
MRCILLLALLLTGPHAFAADALVVFAAASLTDSLQKASDAYTRKSGMPVKLSFASSSALAKQIENGAAADVFVSADQEWMDYVAGKNLIRTASRADLLGNRLVVIAPADSKVVISLGAKPGFLEALGPQGRLATGEPTSVPVGKYARATLTKLGVWNSLESRLARAENVRVALSYVARGEAPLGIVYATDAAVEPKVRVVAVFPEDTHGPITYPAALTSTAQPSAFDYLRFLQGEEAAAIFERAGFSVLRASRSAGGMISGCQGFAFDLSREMQLLGAQPAGISAGVAAGKAVDVQAGKAYRVTLAEQTRLSFAAPPGKKQGESRAYGGLLRVVPVQGSTLRVTLDTGAWIDVVSGGTVLDSTRHTGSHDCPQVRKSVEFTVKRGAPLTLQLSNAATSTLGLVVTELQ